ncbi:MAG: amidohydrolase [candidate division Zixibacteria bacterium]|nr:amidohydrolase [candidate division Zixibacteria bacterium]
MKRFRYQNENRKLLLHSGNIRTLDPALPSAQAMIIDRDRISWIGNNEDIVSIPADEYKLINLSGKTVMPSFTDSHVHLAHLARSVASLDLDGCKSYAEALARTREFVQTLTKSEWLFGRGWQNDSWSGARLPHRSDLDKISPNNPAAIYSKDDHLIWTNSLGLKIARIDRNTPDPEGGRIIRDGNGEPIGILAEKAADLLYRHCKKPSRVRSLAQIEKVVAECHKKGVTAVGNFDDLGNFELLQEYDSQKGLKVRVRQYIPVRFLDHLVKLKLKSGFGSQYLKIAGTKIFADGALGSQTALMFEPYRGRKGHCGIEVSTEAELTSDIKAAASHGIACAVHAIGDRANHQVLNAFGKLSQRNLKLRHRIEHVQIIKPDDIPRFAQLGIVASVQPSHCSADIDLARRHWGRRSKYAYNFRSLIDSGANLALGSDAPIEKIDPLLGMYSATTRKSFDGSKRFHPEQRLMIAEAAAGFTVGGAYALGDECLYGTITLGKSADIVIMDSDPFRTKPDELQRIDISATFFEGECVYGWDNISA